MATEQIPNGQDTTILFTIQDVNGNPIDINNCPEIVVAVYQKRETVLSTYKKTLSTVDVLDAANGQVAVYVTKKVTSKTLEGRLYAEIAVDVTNTSYPDNKKRSIITKIIVGDIVTSVLD